MGKRSTCAKRRGCGDGYGELIGRWDSLGLMRNPRGSNDVTSTSIGVWARGGLKARLVPGGW
jgi:hypothetical protein